jgi:hypothetical protein
MGLVRGCKTQTGNMEERVLLSLKEKEEIHLIHMVQEKIPVM